MASGEFPESSSNDAHDSEDSSSSPTHFADRALEIVAGTPVARDRSIVIIAMLFIAAGWIESAARHVHFVVIGLTLVVGIFLILLLSRVLLTREHWQVGRLLGICAFCAADAYFATGIVHLVQSARESSETARCMSNVKDLTVALEVYAGDNDERLPEAAKWSSVINRQSEGPFLECPATDHKAGYAFDSLLSTVNAELVDKPSETILIYDSANPPGNANDELTSFDPRHNAHRGYVGYLDGHVKWVYLKDWNAQKQRMLGQRQTYFDDRKSSAQVNSTSH